jgi:hypothetical protein
MRLRPAVPNLLLFVTALSLGCNNHVTRIGVQTPTVQRPTNNSRLTDRQETGVKGYKLKLRLTGPV